MIIKSLDHLKIISNKIAEKISPKDCIFLIGEIGVGKTTFARSIINYIQEREGLSKTQVLSPTFNLLYEYEIKKLKIMHYDLYRIKKSSEIIQLGIFDEDIENIKIIEWPQLIEVNVIDRLEIKLNYSRKENERELSLAGYGKWKNIKINEL